MCMSACPQTRVSLPAFSCSWRLLTSARVTSSTEIKGTVLTQTCSNRADFPPRKKKTRALSTCWFVTWMRTSVCVPIYVNFLSTNSWWNEGGQNCCCSKLMESCAIWQSYNRLHQLNGWLRCSGKLLQERILLPFLLCESRAAIDSIIYCIFHATGAIRSEV